MTRTAPADPMVLAWALAAAAAIARLDQALACHRPAIPLGAAPLALATNVMQQEYFNFGAMRRPAPAG